MSEPNEKASRTLVIASVVAVVALVVGSAMFVALINSSRVSRVNGAYGAISCSTPTCLE